MPEFKVGPYKIVIDDEDWQKVKDHTWTVAIRKDFLGTIKCVQTNIDGKTVGLHNLVSGYTFCDHKNGDVLDNRKTNLRSATHKQNMANQSKSVNNTSGWKGVTKHKKSGKWQVQIEVNGKVHYLGYYKCPTRGALAYDSAAIKHFKEFARPNIFPNPYL